MTDPLRAETERSAKLVALADRLDAHGGAHEYIANADNEQKQWMNDCYDAAAHLRALQAENDRLQGDLKHLREVRDPGGCECSDDDACMFARQRDAFKAECEALRVDAARIDWIAENPVAALDVVGYARPSDALYFRAEIDHAINREREPCA